ncbi:MAG: restriction endonuclease subunit S, partial [Vampirovibrionales bacterium]
MLFLKATEHAMKVKSAGGLQPFVSLTFLRNHPFPLPPLAEQKRIVAKVDACFAKLDATDAQLAHAERLVGQCRKSILNQAVRGQLLPQDANDEPAIELLKRIQAEKPVSKKTRHPEHREGSPERGVAGGGEILRCTQDDGVGGVEHPPFEIPPSWVWTRLGEAFNLVGGSTPSTSQARFYSENAIKWLTPADLSKLDDVYIYSGKKDITEAGLKSCSSQV